ncbi:MAG: hypothetical protein GX622_09385 [Bacteroidales bacterium]|nr:hypothetical protein [Bacteroidales bacterium]
MLILSGCGQKKNPAAKETKAETEVSETDIPDTDSKGKPLGVKSGIIEYSYSGDKTGKSTQYFDDYGMKSAVYAEIVQRGEESKGWSLTLGEDQYMWDLNSSQGMKSKNPMVKQMMELSGGDILEYMAGMYEQMGMTKSGTENFQGKECTVFKGDMGKVLIWKGLMMMMEMKIGDMVSRQEVTSIKTNVKVDGKYFRIPDDITFNEIPGF